MKQAEERIRGKYRYHRRTTSKNPLTSSPRGRYDCFCATGWSLTQVWDHRRTHHCVWTSLGRRDGYHSMRGDTMVVDVFPLVLRSAMVCSIIILKGHGPLPLLRIVAMVIRHLVGSKLWRENAWAGRNNVSSRMRRRRQWGRV